MNPRKRTPHAMQCSETIGTDGSAIYLLLLSSVQFPCCRQCVTGLQCLNSEAKPLHEKVQINRCGHRAISFCAGRRRSSLAPWTFTSTYGSTWS